MSYPALPESFSARIREQFSSSSEDFLNALDREINTSVLLHPTKSKFLSVSGTPVPWNDFGMLLNERPSFILDPSYHAGAMYSQEANSMLLAQVFKHILPELKAPVVLDLCAAPGGKSLVLSTLLPEDGLLVSNEIIPQRLSILRENLDKWGLANGLTMGLSPEKIPFSGQLDVIVVDAPCSGEGLFRRQLSYRDEWKSSFAGVCASKQEEILEEAHRLLKPGGFLIYSTCTYNSKENEQQLLTFLEQGWESVRLFVPDEWKIVEAETQHEGRTLFSYRFYPHLVVGEGFFLSVLRKTDREKKRKLHVKNPHLAPLNVRKLAFLEDWVENMEDFAFYQTGKQDIFALPASQAEKMHLIGETLGAWSTGYAVGTRKHDDLEPSAAWALSGEASSKIPKLELAYEDALEFLRKNDLALPVSETKGWHLATFEGASLGWLKALPTRWNNYYPAPWRIRNL